MKCRTFEIDENGFPEESKRFQNLFDAIKNFKGTSQQQGNIKPGVSELFESNPKLANSVYEALGFNQIITPKDKIIFGHPGIGKTFAKKSNNFIDVDEDYKEEHTMQKILRANAKNTGKKEDLKEWEDYVTTWWNKVKDDAKKSGKQIFVSNLPILRLFPQDFDKVINISKAKFIERAKQRNDYKQGETEDWKNSLDIEIAKINRSKVVNTEEYLSDLFITPQQKQQAQQLYSQYLDITTQPNIEGFKEFVGKGETKGVPSDLNYQNLLNLKPATELTQEDWDDLSQEEKDVIIYQAKNC